MPIKGYNTIKYNHGEKSIKIPFTIYADLECLLEKMSTYHQVIQNLFCSFDESKNKITYYRGDDCMKKFCKDLIKHSTKIINYVRKR